ncbi:MAG: hypothetical protein ACLTBF_06460 [Christensenellales bacterium]
MKKPFFSVPRTLILHALTTFLIGVGCVWPLSLSLGLTAPLEECVVCCGAVTLLFALLDCLPRLRALAYPLLLAGISGVAFAMRGQFAAVGAALALLVHGQPLALAAYSQEITLLLALVFTGIGASLSRSDQAFPLALLEIACCSSFRFSARRSAPRRCAADSRAALSRAPTFRRGALCRCAPSCWLSPRCSCRCLRRPCRSWRRWLCASSG